MMFHFGRLVRKPPLTRPKMPGLDSRHEDCTRLTAATQSLGVLGFIIGTAAGQRNIAGGIGYYGAAISIYERWIKRGREVTFSRDTRLVLQTRPRCSLSPTLPRLLPAEPLNA
jgi:hypothetical protein